jgi:hypothetical protein
VSGYDVLMETALEALTTNTIGSISIRDLAQLIETPVERLRALVENKYLRVVKASPMFEWTIVARPGQRAAEWLRNMFQPLKMRPVIPLKEAGKLWGVTECEVLKYCQIGKIPVQSDPVFGKLITFSALKSLARARHRYHKPKRFDRAGLLRYYLSEIEGVRWKEPPPYSVRLEKEIGRIATLKEPWRTIQSMELINAFRDARRVTECLRPQKEIIEELRKSEHQILDLFKRTTGLEATWGDGSPEEKSRTEGPVPL